MGERLDAPCRVFSRPGFPVIRSLQTLADALEVEYDASATRTQHWHQQASATLGWAAPGEKAWPIGQSVGLAATLRDRYQTTGRLIQALFQTSQAHLQLAQALQPLQPHSPLALAHGTEYPIVQGPMTRVSDTAEFAHAVAQGGGLPLLALALMRGSQVLQLLQKTQALLGDLPWGIGILGFAAHSLRDEQMQAVLAVKPPFALIAGGRPDQAVQLEAQGIATYIHVPVPRLLKLFLEQGAKRFVFEGRECGGHVGPLSSFVLWESMVDTLLVEVPAADAANIHVLFAGGIHDARSAAMVSTLAAPLVKHGIKIGVLMGTAYLFTEEAVACGAILPGFQEQALACTQTVNLETGPGHASRCAVTPFTEEFYRIRRQMMAAGSTPEEIKNALEELNLGRLRIASKGLVRDASGQIVAVDAQQQSQDGMYMIGQVATLRSQILTVRNLHQDVAVRSGQLLAKLPQSIGSESNAPGLSQPSDIAVIGLGTLLPKAQYPAAFWENILRKVDAITEIPAHRWDWRLYYDADRRAKDKIYSKWGGFIDEIPFDPMRFGIPPKSLRSIEPVQLMTLEVVRQALEDAGYGSGDFDRENTSVILGAGGGFGDLGSLFATRSEMPRVVDAPTQQMWDRLPDWTEETFPGLLMNVAAGRTANRFDFGGANFTVDAACASSLAAVDLAVKELESGRSNLVIAGGIDAFQSPFTYFCFSKTQALSPRGHSRTFDKSADGIAISEGIAVVILKRLADAERDGDRIYGVIKAVAASSDGKALGMTAPLPAGQMRALKRAYRKAGFQASTLGMYEAHGTGTAVGDKAELETVHNTLVAEKTPGKSCLIGSVKTMVGHTKCSAGVSGLIKSVLSMYHQVLPPHIGVDNPLDLIADPESPVYLLKEARPWFAHPEHPRRAGVSAFGFGGTNFHVVLEEYQGLYKPSALGGGGWPAELLILRAESKESLVKEIQSLQVALNAGAEPRLRDLAYSYARQSQQRQNQPACMSLVVENLQHLQLSLELALEHLLQGRPTALPPHIQLNLAVVANRGKIAFLFPGQGAQYPNMAREVALYFQEMRQAIEFADRHLRPCFSKQLSQFIYPPSGYSETEEKFYERQLTATQIAQPAIGAIAMGYLALASRLGLQADMTGGHSFGEYAALFASGVLSQVDFLNLAELRGRTMAEACQGADGAMAALQLPRDQVQSYLQDADNVVIANHNAPLQSVISGDRPSVSRIVQQVQETGASALVLPVGGAFHSPLVTAAQIRLSEAISQVSLSLPQIPVYANQTARLYETDATQIRQQLSVHMLSTVEFVQQIETMHADGARIFLELGPKSILTNLVGQILAGQNHTAVALDGQGDGIRGLLTALATLVMRGVGLDLPALFQGREVQPLDLTRLVELTRKPPLSATTCFVSGAGIRSQTEAVSYPGKCPPLNQETAAQAIAIAQSQPQQTGWVDHPGLDPVLPSRSPSISPAPSPSVSSGGRPPMPTPPLPVVAKSESQKSVIDTQAISLRVPAPLHPAVSPMVNEAALSAYQAYQETMRLFLNCQEQVMTQFLRGGQSIASQNQVPLTSPPALSSRQPQELQNGSRNGNHNGGGAAAADVHPHATSTAPPPVAERQLRSEVFKPSTGESSQPFAPVVPAIPESHTIIAGRTPSATSAPSQLPDRASLTHTLLALVSDRTGYPVEMLGLDQDMEADLGIDSIKRVEILGALQKSLPEPLAANLQTQMESFTRAKTLKGVVEQLLHHLPPAASTPSTDHHGTATPNGSGFGSVAVPNQASLTQILVGLVSDRTGYPAEMLGLDQDMEADLGIDSIKRVEILGALQKSLPEPLAANLQTQMESFTRVKTLNGILEQLGQVGSNSVVLRSANDPLIPNQFVQEENRLGKSEAPSGVIPLPRFKMEPELESLPKHPPVSLQGLFLISEDPGKVATQVAHSLNQQGVHAIVIPADTLLNPDQLTQRVAQLRQKYGPVIGIVHLTALASRSMPETLGDWRHFTQLDVKSFYHLLHICAQDLKQAGHEKIGRVFSASLLGGNFGRVGTSGSGLPTGGCHNGLLKSLGEEWPGMVTKAVDFDETLPADALAERIIQELLLPGGRTEVGYPSGNRTIFRTLAAPLSLAASSVNPDAQWVVLVTGGARGITAEITADLAALGVRLVITGRSPQPAAESPQTLGIEAAATLRQILLLQAQATGISPTPAMIEAQIQTLQRDRAIRNNLERFQQAGAAIVEYHTVDVRIPEEFGGLIQDLYRRYGRLDAVIHGAGIIEDKLIADKTAASFDRVFDTKTDSLFILSRYLRPESLKLLVLFSSVAGRYGNRGQSDYAAANEVMNRLAWKLDQQWIQTHVVSINWGPWDSPGMASEAVKNRFRAEGITPIPVVAGRQFFLQELRYGRKGDVEVIAGEGPWEKHEADLGAFAKVETLSQPQLPGFVFLQSQPQLQANSTVTLEHTFSLMNDPYLKDHCLDSKPVLPAAGALEWLAEFVQSAWPEWRVAEVRNLKVFKGFVIDQESGNRPALFQARASSHADAESLQIAAEILDPDSKLVFYKASVILQPKLSKPPLSELEPLTSGSSLDAKKAYLDYLFHGSCFQLLTAIDCLNGTGVDAQVVPSQSRQWMSSLQSTSPWIFDPGLIDVAPQLAMIWTRIQHGVSALPSRFGSVIRYGDLPLEGVLKIALRVKDFTNQTLIYDVVYTDQNNHVRLHLQDLESTCSATLNRLNLQWRKTNGFS
nr:type I polyketide synthase [Neosynechococcus sphagnicola]